VTSTSSAPISASRSKAKDPMRCALGQHRSKYVARSIPTSAGLEKT
jgi:hypothetical protein